MIASSLLKPGDAGIHADFPWSAGLRAGSLLKESNHDQEIRNAARTGRRKTISSKPSCAA